MAREEAPVALITGAGRRIGQAIARELHAAGWNLLLHYRSSGEAAAALAGELNARRGDSVACHQADLTDMAALQTLARETRARWRRLDALVNNASSYYPTPLAGLSVAQFDDLVGSNLKGPLFLSQACAALMNDGGAIVNILDIHARRPMRGYVAYCAAKAGLWAVTEGLALELAPHIRVNGLAPGRMIWGEGDALDPAQKRREQARIPMGRLGGGEEVARCVRFLLSADAAYLNGAILPVDGGLRLA